MLKALLAFHRDERGFLQWLIPLLTLGMNFVNRQKAAATMNEDILTEGQVREGTLQDFSDRGLSIDASSPAVVEAMRRRSLAKRQQQAQGVLAGPSPWETIFGLFKQ